MQFEVSFQNPNSDKRFELLQFKIKSEMQLRCHGYGDFKKKIKVQRDGAAPPELCRPRRGFGIGRLPNPLAGFSAGCQRFRLAASWLLKLKRRGFATPLKRQKWLRNLLVNTSKWPHFTFSSGDKSHRHYYQDLVPHLYAKSGKLNPTTRWDRCTEFFGLGAVPWQACYSCVSLLCTLNWAC